MTGMSSDGSGPSLAAQQQALPPEPSTLPTAAATSSQPRGSQAPDFWHPMDSYVASFQTRSLGANQQGANPQPLTQTTSFDDSERQIPPAGASTPTAATRTFTVKVTAEHLAGSPLLIPAEAMAAWRLPWTGKAVCRLQLPGGRQVASVLTCNGRDQPGALAKTWREAADALWLRPGDILQLRAHALFLTSPRPLALHLSVSRPAASPRT